MTDESRRLTSAELYQVIFRELLSAALPGQPAKQAPRMLVSMLEAIETLVTSIEAPPYPECMGSGSSC